MERRATEDPRGFRDGLVEWFEREGKDYPWRRTRDPHAVLVSEVMLQQTRISTVLGKRYYERFLEAFPRVDELAAADDESLLKAWEGLGYYRRARMLRETARAVLVEHGGAFPEGVDALLALPGVGRYTAGALRAFAFDLPAVLVDGNVARVLARVLDFRKPVDESAGQRWVWERAAELADDERPASYHSALMELGQVYCRKGLPDCLACPVSRWCAAPAPEELPVKKARAKVTAVDEHALWLRDGRGRVLMRRETGKRRTGLWTLPLRQVGEVAGMSLATELAYTITRYRVTLRVWDGGIVEEGFGTLEGEAWKTPEDIRGLAMAAPFRKAVERLLTDSGKGV